MMAINDPTQCPFVCQIQWISTTLSITEHTPADRNQLPTEADVCMASGGEGKAHHAVFSVTCVSESCAWPTSCHAKCIELQLHWEIRI